MSNHQDDILSEEETARRRDEVIRRMANTPPQHRASQARSRKTAKATAGRRKGRKAVRRGKSEKGA